jgi:hypothetical protein
VLVTMRSWLPLAERDIPVSSRDYGEAPTVADDVIEDAGRL